MLKGFLKNLLLGQDAITKSPVLTLDKEQLEKTGMTFTKEQVDDQKDKVEVLRYRYEDLYSKLLEADDKFKNIAEKLEKEKRKLMEMKENEVQQSN